MYGAATPEENRRFKWPEHTLLMANQSPVLRGASNSEYVWIYLPIWIEDERHWAKDERGRISFERRDLLRVQRLALGHFVEHRATSSGSTADSARIHRPVFRVFGAEDEPERRRTRALTDTAGGVLLRSMEPRGGVQLSAPHTRRRLDIAAPVGFNVAVVSPSDQDLGRPPLKPYDCENGECEDPDDPLDECRDGIDNDGDGHGDLCDWNCLPHADFGADAFPDARSRVENGKTFAMMGGGTICTDLQDTWMTTFADWALEASSFLAQVQPGLDRPVRYRTFSCWIFDDQDAVQLCQHGPYEAKQGPLAEDECPVNWLGPQICPPGLEDYPYQPTEAELMLSQSDSADYCGDRNVHYFNELPRRGWRDLEINTVALGALGEPANGVVYLTSDIQQLCSEGESCTLLAGVAMREIAGAENVGFLAVSNANPLDWHTLAHETGHSMGLEHDSAVGGFMNPNSGGLLPTLEMFNVTQWTESMTDKGWFPRSSGWYNTGCTGYDECAPLGKPGWSCDNGQYCEQEGD